MAEREQNRDEDTILEQRGLGGLLGLGAAALLGAIGLAVCLRN